MKKDKMETKYTKVNAVERLPDRNGYYPAIWNHLPCCMDYTNNIVSVHLYGHDKPKLLDPTEVNWLWWFEEIKPKNGIKCLDSDEALRMALIGLGNPIEKVGSVSMNDQSFDGEMVKKIIDWIFVNNFIFHGATGERNGERKI